MIDINAPGCEIVGYLDDLDDPADRGELMVEVLTRSGIWIDAGWEPDGDPAGRYVVTANLKLKELARFETDDVREAANKVEELAMFYSRV
jgi:hypothetical protein